MTENFNLAFDQTLEHEGGYADHPRDRGGETYKGVARNFWGSWPGWKIIDEAKAKLGKNPRHKQINAVLAGNKKLDSLIREFYREHFWIASGADQLPDQLARKHFNCAVNVGVGGAVRILQRALRAHGQMIAVDGAFGPRTKAAAWAVVAEPLIDTYCRKQKSYYKRIIERRPSQVVFQKGWFRRAAFRG